MPSKKLFAHLRFFFYPQRGISRLNGLKATACAKHGAYIQSSLSAETTHILVSRGHTSQKFWDLVKNSAVPRSCEVLDSEWPSVCIEAGTLEKPTAFRITETSEAPATELQKPKRPREESAEEAGESIGGEVVQSNQVLIDGLHDIIMAREAAGEEFSARAYKQALKAVELSSQPIVTKESALKLGLSSRMAQFVCDLRSSTGILSIASRQKAETLRLFATVYGVGPYLSRILYQKGFRTLDDIKGEVDQNGRVSIEHHQDFIERMSRTEVDKHFQKVKKLVALVDSELHVECMGSHRRGSLDCGDIDIILTKKDVEQKELKKSLKALLEMMFDSAFALHTFAKGPDRWLGATQVISKWRRMDILLVPWKELGAAMIYYTGDDMFNRRLRLRAKRNGMRLSQNGLYRISSGSPVLLESHDEKRIFELLKAEYLEPEQRVTKL